MSRTRRCAPDVEAGLIGLLVVPGPGPGFTAMMTVRRPSAEDHRSPVSANGDGATVARAVGAAEAEAWRMLQETDESVVAPEEPAKDRRQLELLAKEE